MCTVHCFRGTPRQRAQPADKLQKRFKQQELLCRCSGQTCSLILTKFILLSNMLQAFNHQCGVELRDSATSASATVRKTPSCSCPFQASRIAELTLVLLRKCHQIWYAVSGPTSAELSRRKRNRAHRKISNTSTTPQPHRCTQGIAFCE